MEIAVVYEDHTKEREDSCQEFAIGVVSLNYGRQGFSPCYLLNLAREFKVVTQVLELGLGEDTSTSLADYNSMYSEIENLMELDDKDQFAAFLTKYHDKLLSFGPQDLFSLLVSHSAVGCLTALLDSRLQSHVDVNQSLPHNTFPLDFAAWKLCFGMVTLLLQHGADPDAGSIYGIPLHSAICSFRFMVLHLVVRYASKVFGALEKESLDTVKVLALKSKQVENLCFKYVANKEIINFATLLTAAPGKLLVQLVKGLENTPVGQYIFRELKCETNRAGDWISYSKKKNLVDAFYVVRTFCLNHGLLVRCCQLVLEGGAGDEDSTEIAVVYEDHTKEREDSCQEFAIGVVSLNYGRQGFSPCYLLNLAREFKVVTQVLELGLGEDTSTSLADYNSMYSEIENLMELDDKDQFAAFLTKYHDKLLSFGPQDLFSLLVSHSAVGCLTALLDSRLQSHVDVNQSLPHNTFPLDFAAWKLCFGMVTLLLQHGADPDAGSIYGIPLQSAICSFRSHDFMLDWNPGKSIIELFTLICSAQMKESLDTVKVLASKSKQVENLCFEYVANREIINFATLLTAASDKLFLQLEKGLEYTPVGQYIFGELKCETNRANNWISSSKRKNLVDAFYVVKTFCLINSLLEQCCQLVLEDVPKFMPPLDILSTLVREGWLAREPVDKDNTESLLSKLTSEARVLSQKHYGSTLRAFTRERRMGIAGYSTLPLRSKFSYQAFCKRQGADFNPIKLVETQPYKCTLVKPSLVKKVVPIMWLAKRSIK